jgi:hypothetical protein
VSRVRRFRGFLLASGSLIAATAILSGFLVGRVIERHALALEEAATARVVQTQARQHLVAGDFELAAPGTAPRPFGRFLLELPDVVRLKVYDRTGRVVWSDEPRLIGLAFADNPPLARALRGQVTTVLGAPERAEHLYERVQTYVAEAYVPVTLPGRAEVVGVIETYKDATVLVRAIQRTQRLVWSAAGGLGALLYGALVVVVWTASRNEQRAFRRLEAHNRKLALLHDLSRALLQPLDLVRLAATVTHRTGTGLRLARAALYRAAAGGALVRLSRWPEGVDAEPPAAALAARALQAARPLAEGRTLAIPLQAGGPRGEVFLAEFGGDAGEPDPEAVRVLEIMLDGAAIALANAELLAELLARTEQLEQANAALRSAQAQLVEHERLAAVGELVVGLHDAILNPLSGILGALQVLKADTLGVPERLEALAHAEQASRRIEGVLRRLTTLRRAARTRYVGETTMLDLDVPAGS